ncbi:TPA: phage tail tube protein [Vibrio vulnificus]|uniref:phage tail tube protein n=1 Tax=Vibrio vulnificus TaxID=672 RepID=UPI0028C57250|nr:phage tail protein [Vibrio vulnificus]
MATPNPTTTPTKGAGTTFWRLKDSADLSQIADLLADEQWTLIAKVKEIQPGEVTVEDEEDQYLDDVNPDWTTTAPGQKSAGELSLTLAWMPGDTAQQQLYQDVVDGKVTYYRTKYPNGTVDIDHGYINGWGKAVAQKERMSRAIKIKKVGKPKTAEEILASVAQASAEAPVE